MGKMAACLSRLRYVCRWSMAILHSINEPFDMRDKKMVNHSINDERLFQFLVLIARWSIICFF